MPHTCSKYNTIDKTNTKRETDNALIRSVSNEGLTGQLKGLVFLELNDTYYVACYGTMTNTCIKHGHRIQFQKHDNKVYVHVTGMLIGKTLVDKKQQAKTRC